MTELLQVNYLGHLTDTNLGNKGRGVTFTFKWGREQKPLGSMIIGTSPEFDLALYTTCVLARSASTLLWVDVVMRILFQKGREVPRDTGRAAS